MSRLPEPGGDDGTWGEILNDFLAVAHQADGTLKPTSVPEQAVADGSVTPAKLSQSYVATSEKAASNGVATLDGTGKVPVGQLPAAAVAGDATTTTKGIVQLTGDLGGTASAPTVPGLSTKYVKPAGGIPEADLDSSAQAKLNAGASVSDATTTSKGIVQLAGDLAGTAAAPTVPGLAAKAADSAVVHNTGAETVAGVKTFSSSPVVPTPSTPTQAANKSYVDSTVAAGAADATTTTKGIVQLAGDLAGTAAAPTVPGLAAKANAATTISAGTGLTGGGDLSASRTLTVSYGTAAGTAAQGNDSRITGAEQTVNKGATNGYASLDGTGKVPTAQLPALGESNTASNIGTTGVGVYKQKTGVNLELKKINPASTKLSVVDNTANNTLDLDVVTANLGLTKSDVGLGSVDNTSDANKPVSTATQTALNLKANTATTISAGTGLTGGGDLSANRTLTVSYGTAAGTAAQGNDSRITGAEQTANKGVANGYAGLDGAGKIPAGLLAVSKTQCFSSSSNLMLEAGTHRLYNDSPAAWTITSVRATVGTAPTGSSIIIDVNVGGTTIFTTQANRPTIAASGFTSGKVTNMDVTTVATGDYLTVDVDQIGSTTPGADLTVQIEVA